MTTIIDFKAKSFLTNLELIARRDPNGCIAILYSDENNVIICQGMQAELLYWFSHRFTPQTYESVFSEINSLYDVDEETLHRDLSEALQKMCDLKLISIC